MLYTLANPYPPGSVNHHLTLTFFCGPRDWILNLTYGDSDFYELYFRFHL